MKDDLISRRAAIEVLDTGLWGVEWDKALATAMLKDLPSAQPERLTDDDFETIRIHLNAYKEKLCNQQRWKEAEEYQCMIDRFMEFASAQPEVTEEAVKEYCRRRHLIVLTNDYFHALSSAQSDIIRCKDCKHWMMAYLAISGKHGCNIMRDYTASDDYCFKAERKQDG